MMKVAEMFDPVLFSIEEAQFLAQYAGESPEVAELDGFPAGVNPNAVLPALDRIFRLQQQQDARQIGFVGIAPIKEACLTYVKEMKKWEQDAKRGGPKHPSMYTWDERGRGTKGAVGSDSTQVKTYFDAGGNRLRFEIELIPSGQSQYIPSWVKAAAPKPVPHVIEDKDKGFVTCPICHFTQNFEPGTQNGYNMARGRMAKHLKGTQRQAEAHREVYLVEFAS